MPGVINNDEREASGVVIEVVDTQPLIDKGWEFLKEVANWGQDTPDRKLAQRASDVYDELETMFRWGRAYNCFLCDEGVGRDLCEGGPFFGLYGRSFRKNAISVAPVITMALTIDMVEDLQVVEQVPLEDFIRKGGVRLHQNYEIWRQKLRQCHEAGQQTG